LTTAGREGVQPPAEHRFVAGPAGLAPSFSFLPAPPSPPPPRRAGGSSCASKGDSRAWKKKLLAPLPNGGGARAFPLGRGARSALGHSKVEERKAQEGPGGRGHGSSSRGPAAPPGPARRGARCRPFPSALRPSATSLGIEKPPPRHRAPAGQRLKCALFPPFPQLLFFALVFCLLWSNPANDDPSVMEGGGSSSEVANNTFRKIWGFDMPPVGLRNRSRGTVALRGPKTC